MLVKPKQNLYYLNSIAKMTEKITKTLYGNIDIDFLPNSHQYRKGKERLISVTAVTGQLDKSGPLMYWAANLCKEHLLDMYNNRVVIDADVIEKAIWQYREKRDQAADTGTIVHEWAEKHIAGENPPIPENDDAINGIIAYLKWVKEHDVKFYESERMVYSKKHNYVGLMDAAAVIDGKKYAVDFKTSKGIYPEYYMQIAAYRAALTEETGEEFDGSIIVNFSKETGDFSLYETEDHDKDFEAFVGLLYVKNWLKSFKK